MIKVGTKTYDDQGFFVSTEKVGDVTREVLNVELKQGLTTQALNALCTGPITIVGEDGETQGQLTGPFQIAGLTLKLMRETAEDDVAHLTGQVTGLQEELMQANGEKQSAQSALASLQEQLQTLRSNITAAGGEAEPGEAVVQDAPSGVTQ